MSDCKSGDYNITGARRLFGRLHYTAARLPLCQSVGEMGRVPVAQSTEIILYQLQIALLVSPVLACSCCHRCRCRCQKSTLQQLLPDLEVKLFSQQVRRDNCRQFEFEFSMFYKCRWPAKQAWSTLPKWENRMMKRSDEHFPREALVTEEVGAAEGLQENASGPAHQKVFLDDRWCHNEVYARHIKQLIPMRHPNPKQNKQTNKTRALNSKIVIPDHQGVAKHLCAARLQTNEKN